MLQNIRNKLIAPLGFQDLIVILGVLSLLGTQIVDFAADPGVGWHLGTGRFIVSTHSIPYVDPFLSYIHPRAWVSDQWLSDVFLYLLYRAGAWPLVYAVLTVVYLAIYFIVLYPGVVAVSGSAFAASLVVLLAFKMGQIHFILRPAMLGFLFFSAVYTRVYAFYKFSHGSNAVEGKREIHKLTISLAPLFLIWANLHPSFVLGLILVSLLTVGIILDALIARRESTVLQDLSLHKSLILIPLVCFAATLVNPYGYHLHESIAALGRSDFFMKFHGEWLSPNFRNAEGIIFEILAVVILLSAFLTGKFGLYAGFFEFLVLIVFSHMGLKAVRMLPYFAIAASIPAACALANFGEAKVFTWHESLGRLVRRVGLFDAREKRSQQGFILVLLLTVAILCDSILWKRLLIFKGPYGPGVNAYPVAALRALKPLASQSHKLVVASDPSWGGYIAFEGEDLIKPIIDDRNTLIGEEFYKEYFEKMKIGADWKSYLQKLKVTHLMLAKSSQFGLAIKREGALRVIYEDAIAMVFQVEQQGERV